MKKDKGGRATIFRNWIFLNFILILEITEYKSGEIKIWFWKIKNNF